MGNSKILLPEPYTTMADEKKSIKDKFIKPLLALFEKGKKNKKIISNKLNSEKVKDNPTQNQPTDNKVKTAFSYFLDCLEEEEVKKRILEETIASTVEQDNRLVENFEKLAIDKKKQSEKNEDDYNESKNFATKIVTAKKIEFNSQTSEGTGFAESSEESKEKDVKVDSKPKKTQEAFLKRGPLKNKRTPYRENTVPYSQYSYNQSHQSKAYGQANEVYETPQLINSLQQQTDSQREVPKEYISEELSLVVDLIQEMQKEEESKSLNYGQTSDKPNLVFPETSSENNFNATTSYYQNNEEPFPNIPETMLQNDFNGTSSYGQTSEEPNLVDPRSLHENNFYGISSYCHTNDKPIPNISQTMLQNDFNCTSSYGQTSEEPNLVVPRTLHENYMEPKTNEELIRYITFISGLSFENNFNGTSSYGQTSEEPNVVVPRTLYENNISATSSYYQTTEEPLPVIAAMSFQNNCNGTSGYGQNSEEPNLIFSGSSFPNNFDGSYCVANEVPDLVVPDTSYESNFDDYLNEKPASEEPYMNLSDIFSPGSLLSNNSEAERFGSITYSVASEEPIPSVSGTSCEKIFNGISSPETRLSTNNDAERVTSTTCNKQRLPSSPRPTKTKLKYYKTRQRQLRTGFMGKECCQIAKPCKEIFLEHLQKLDGNTRKCLVINVARLDLSSAYKYLKDALSVLSKSNREENNIQLIFFAEICQRILSTQKQLFIENFGFNLLKIAVLECPHRPVITRYLVQCIRAVTRSEAYKPTGNIVFPQVDSNNDNLLINCVRAGDDSADVLRELVRFEQNDIPLFNIEHANNDGYRALHACCAEHSPSKPQLHTLHVLLEHANADCRAKDIKGDTPLHLAVRSDKCQLDFILLYLHNKERDTRHELVQKIKNGSKETVLKCAKKAKASETYSKQILDFLGKCRK